MPSCRVLPVKGPSFPTKPRLNHFKRRDFFEKLLNESVSQSRIYLDGCLKKNRELAKALANSEVAKAALIKKLTCIQNQLLEGLAKQAILRQKLAAAHQELSIAKETILVQSAKLAEFCKSEDCGLASAMTGNTQAELSVPVPVQRTLQTGIAGNQRPKRRLSSLQVANHNTNHPSASTKPNLLHCNTSKCAMGQLSPITECSQVDEDFARTAVLPSSPPSLYKFVSHRNKKRVKESSSLLLPPGKDDLKDEHKENRIPDFEQMQTAIKIENIKQELTSGYDLRPRLKSMNYKEPGLRKKIRQAK